MKRNRFIYWMPYFPILGFWALFILGDWQLDTCLDDADHFIGSAVVQGAATWISITYLL